MSNETATLEATIERIAAEFQTRKPANYQFDAFQKYKRATALREGKVAPANRPNRKAIDQHRATFIP